MNTSPQVQEVVEYPVRDGQDRNQESLAKREARNNAVAELYGKYIHAVMSHPKFERRRRKR